MNVTSSILVALALGAPPDAELGDPAPDITAEDSDAAAETDADTDGTEDPAEEDLDPVIEAAKVEYEHGMAEYRAGRYMGAVDRWVAAYGTLDASYEHARIRAAIIYNIANAQSKQFGIDGKIEHLRQARTSLKSYADEIDDVYPAGPERDSEHVLSDDKLVALEASITEAEEAERTARLEEARAGAPKFDPVLDAQQRRTNRGMIISGSVMTGLGIAAAGTLTAGLASGAAAERELPDLETAAELARRREVIRQGKTGNAMALIGAITTPLLVGTGVGLLVAGLVREKRRKAHGESMTPTVAWSIGGPGVVLHGRF